MKQLLCPFDFSDAAVSAAEYAAHLARDRNMGLVLLYIEQVSAWHGAVPVVTGELPLVDNPKGITQENLRFYAASLENEFKIRCKADLRTYAAPVAIAVDETIALGDFELVIMGTSGANSEMDLFFGTTSYQVIKETQTPLLLVPENCRFVKPANIMYATDYCPDDLAQITKLLILFARYRPKLAIVHVSKKRTAVSDEVFRCFRHILDDEIGQKRTVRFRRAIGEDMPGILTDMMREYDLLVLLTRHHHLVSRIFRRSTLRKLSLFSDFPILVFPDQMNN